MKWAAIRELLLWVLVATLASVHLVRNWPWTTNESTLEARGPNSSHHSCDSQKAFDHLLHGLLHQNADLDQLLGLCTTQLKTVRTQMRAMTSSQSLTKAAAAHGRGRIGGPHVRTGRSSSNEPTVAVGGALGASEDTQAPTLTGAPPPLRGLRPSEGERPQNAAQHVPA